MALDAYYQEYAQQHPIDLLTESGFIGCGEAEDNLSTHYKLAYGDSLEEKYGLTQ